MWRLRVPRAHAWRSRPPTLRLSFVAPGAAPRRARASSCFTGAPPSYSQSGIAAPDRRRRAIDVEGEEGAEAYQTSRGPRAARLGEASRRSPSRSSTAKRALVAPLLCPRARGLPSVCELPPTRVCQLPPLPAATPARPHAHARPPAAAPPRSSRAHPLPRQRPTRLASRPATRARGGHVRLGASERRAERGALWASLLARAGRRYASWVCSSVSGSRRTRGGRAARAERPFVADSGLGEPTDARTRALAPLTR